MISKDPFSPLGKQDRFAFALLTTLAGLASLAFVAFILIKGPTLVGVLVAFVLSATGICALVIARRLYYNQSPYEEGYLVSPRLTLAVGILFVAVGVGSVLTDSLKAAWLFAPGIAAILFGWQRRRAKRRSLQHRADGA